MSTPAWPARKYGHLSTTEKGNLAEAKAVAHFLSLGWVVSAPCGNGHPYDLVVDDGARRYRVQVKTAELALADGRPSLSRIRSQLKNYEFDLLAVVSEHAVRVVDRREY